ncbi:MAG: hypothetical protein LBJ32_02315 [Oscillospiraceae bacterium]|jgi:hypothetical protein|nr:hypothetical protein [Oscillospiraceae bacterium]
MIYRKVFKKFLSIVFIVSLFVNNISGNNSVSVINGKNKSDNNKKILINKANKRKILLSGIVFTSLSFLLHFFKKNNLKEDVHESTPTYPLVESEQKITSKTSPIETEHIDLQTIYPGSEDLSYVMFNSNCVNTITSEQALDYLKKYKFSYQQFDNPFDNLAGRRFEFQMIRNEMLLYENIKQYFFQVTDGFWKGLIFIKNNNKFFSADYEFFPAGYFELITLQDLELKNQNISLFPSEINGRIVIIYANHKIKPIDISEVKGDEVGAFGVASDFNGTTTQVRKGTVFNDYCWYYGKKYFNTAEYVPDRQGQIIMTKHYFANMVLLNLLNARKGYFPFFRGDPLEELIQYDGCGNDFNLLGKFGVQTKNGFAMIKDLQNSFANKENDGKFTAICIRHSPVVINIKPIKKTLYEKICLSNLIIYASFNNLIDWYKHIDKKYDNIQSQKLKFDCIEANLRRYYKFILLYAKLNKLKTICVPFLGIGAFFIPLIHHLNVLNELEKEIVGSGVTVIINAFLGSDCRKDHVKDLNWPSYIKTFNVEDCEDFAKVVEKVTNSTF